MIPPLLAPLLVYVALSLIHGLLGLLSYVAGLIYGLLSCTATIIVVIAEIIAEIIAYYVVLIVVIAKLCVCGHHGIYTSSDYADDWYHDPDYCYWC